MNCDKACNLRCGWPDADDPDEWLESAKNVICETGVASISMLQRKLKIGYVEASALMERLEQAIIANLNDNVVTFLISV